MSVRGERIVYRERERSSDRGTEAPRRSYTTVKRYQVPDSTRSVFHNDEERKDEKQLVIRRERREPSPPREDVQYRVTERVREREPPREEVDYRFTERFREREPAAPQRRDIAYRVIERDSDYDRQPVTRSTVRAPSPPEPERVREFRFERERDFSPPREYRREQREQPYDIERYSKSTEYFSQPQPAPQPIIIREAAPQPIIIREERREPLIIREERREPHYEFIEREEVRDDTRSLVKREEPGPPVPIPVPVPVPGSTHPPSSHPREPQPEEENYFYERRVREIDRPKQRDEGYDRRTEIRPRDSASQYSSDDSYEYVRRERTYEGRSRSSSRSSPHHKRHLAEGAIAGVGAAEILRHHRKSQGQEVGGRGTQALAGAAVGALGVKAASKVRSRVQSRRGGSRNRSRSSSYDGGWERRDRRSRRKKRSRSRSKSLSRAQTLGGLAAVAAVGALAGYALNKNKNNKETVIINDPPRRSRSRRRRASADSYMTGDRTMMSDESRRESKPDNSNRNVALAGAGAAGAAALWEKHRSKSRGRNRSKSKVRQAVPVVASGLGGAALAGLYEKNKASKEAKKEAIIEDEMGRGRRRRSRSRSRSVPAKYHHNDEPVDHRGMIAYGHEPVYPEQGRGGYYSDDEPAMYRRRHHGGSSGGSSPDTRRRGSRSHSRNRNLAVGGAAAGLAAVGAHEYGKRRERSRNREVEERRRHEEEAYHDPYARDHEGMYSPPPQPGGYLSHEEHGGYPEQQAYPGSTYFPPPPTAEYGRQAPPAAEQNPYPAYNPQDYAHGGVPQAPYHQYNGYGDSEANLGAPYPNDTFAGDPRYAATPEPEIAAEHHDEHRHGRGERDPDDVSAHTDASAMRGREYQDADGVSTPRAGRSRSHSRVRFDLDANKIHSPDTVSSKREDERPTDSETSGDQKHHRRRRRHQDRARDGDGHRDSPQLMHDQYERQPESDSDGTIELPERFDENGNKKADDDPLATGLGRILGDVGFTDMLERLRGGGGGHGGGGHGGAEDSGRSGRRRHRH